MKKGVKVIDELVTDILEIKKEVRLYQISKDNKSVFIEYEKLILLPFITIIKAINDKRLYTAKIVEVTPSQKPKPLVIENKVEKVDKITSSRISIKDIYG